ncbi:hypothetical protein ACSBR2_026670 [Camellia fascicularis]
MNQIIANGKVPDLAEFYKSIHYNSDIHEWISSESQINYDNMIQTQAEHLLQTGAIPLTPEELLVKVLKPRSGYVEGLGMRPSSSMYMWTLEFILDEWADQSIIIAYNQRCALTNNSCNLLRSLYSQVNKFLLNSNFHSIRFRPNMHTSDITASLDSESEKGLGKISLVQ